MIDGFAARPGVIRSHRAFVILYLLYSSTLRSWDGRALWTPYEGRLLWPKPYQLIGYHQVLVRGSQLNTGQYVVDDTAGDESATYGNQISASSGGRTP